MVETSERLITLIPQLFELTLLMAKQFSISASGDHVAFVHFSSPDGRTAVLTNLMETGTYAEFEAKVRSLRQASVLGITDLDMSVFTLYFCTQQQRFRSALHTSP